MSKHEKQKPFEILGSFVEPGKTERLNLEIVKLFTNTPMNIQVIVSHSKKPGPTLLLLGGVHGNETNGIEIVRRIIKNGWNKPIRGTIICIPVFNTFGFLHRSREFPDGRDLNRVFPGIKNGSLASQFAYVFMEKIAPLADIILDFHTGGSQRFNYPQTRCDFSNERAKELCEVFSAPFMVNSKIIKKSLRDSLTKLGKDYVIFEGGKTNNIDNHVVTTGIKGAKRIMNYLGMKSFSVELPKSHSFAIETSSWIRAGLSGILNIKIANGQFVNKGTILATISDPYGKFERAVRAPYDSIIFNVNEIPLINKGDAIFNIGKCDSSSGSVQEYLIGLDRE